MKKKVLFLMFFVFGVSTLFAQSNLKVVEYKILKFREDKVTEFTVPKGQTWKVESIIGRKDDKIVFVVDGDEYILYYSLHVGVTDKFIPFYFPENTVFSLKPAEDNIAFSIAVLKIE